MVDALCDVQGNADASHSSQQEGADVFQNVRQAQCYESVGQQLPDGYPQNLHRGVGHHHRLYAQRTERQDDDNLCHYQ